MSIKASLAGRLRNTILKPNNALLPLFEAVVNSIHAISDAGISGDLGSIVIRIMREAPTAQTTMTFGKGKPGARPLENIIAFEIIDNGIGFNDDNLRSFETLDSLYKAKEGGKGVGRLSWLKAFECAYVDSTFLDNDGAIIRREFTFTDDADSVDNLVESKLDNGTVETSVRLNGFRKEFREEAPRRAQAIARRLLEHCLWYFIRTGGAPRIMIYDGDETINMRDVYDSYMRSSITDDTVVVKGRVFDLDHIKLKATSQSEHFISYCANNRVVKHDAIGSNKIPGLRGPISDEEGEFMYACYVTGDYLNESVRPERIGFEIPSTPNELFSQDFPAMSEIEAAVIEAATKYLSAHLQDLRSAGRKRVMNYVNYKAVRYRSILPYLSDADFWIDPDINDKDLESRLHDRWYEVEKSLIEEGHEVLKFASHETQATYQARIEEYKKKVEAIKQSDLADYVFHRKVVLEILETAVKKRSDGKYEREDLIHQLVMPMRTSSGEVREDQCNLWLLDERLTFHHFLASDKPIRSLPIVTSGDGKEPDICVLDIMDDPLLVSDKTDPPGTLTVIEFKRPMREDVGAKDEDPILQTLDYLRRLRLGKVTDQDGRPIINADEIPGFCYIVCDFTDKMKECCERNQLTKRRDGMVYFGYHPNFKAYIEVISYNQMIKAAKERNYAFFQAAWFAVGLTLGYESHRSGSMAASC